jgi:hypothetical protein
MHFEFAMENMNLKRRIKKEVGKENVTSNSWNRKGTEPARPRFHHVRNLRAVPGLIIVFLVSIFGLHVTLTRFRFSSIDNLQQLPEFANLSSDEDSIAVGSNLYIHVSVPCFRQVFSHLCQIETRTLNMHCPRTLY